MKDGYIRRWIKGTALLCYRIDLMCTKAILSYKREVLYDLRGACNHCGACCESPTLRTWAPFFYLKTARWLFLTWHRLVNGFEYRGEDRRNRVFIFRCSHWDSETKLCDSYESRPGMCRDYPRNLIDSSNPNFFPDCGFYALDKNAEEMNEALDDLSLSAKRLEEIKRKLHVIGPKSQSDQNSIHNEER